MSRMDELPEDVRQIQEASDAATWDAIEAYRDTGEMVPVAQDGKLAFPRIEGDGVADIVAQSPVFGGFTGLRARILQ